MCTNENAGGALAGVLTACGAKVQSVGAVLARLLPNRHLLLPSRLDLRGNAQHTSLACSEWSDRWRGSVWTKRGYEGRGEVYKSGVTLILRWASTPSGSTEPRLRGL